MVTEIPHSQRTLYQCENCKFKYPTKELAERCEQWCGEHQSCNLEIIKYAIEDEGEGSPPAA